MPAPLLPHDDFFVSPPILALMAMPRARRNAVLAFLDALLQQPGEQLAIHASTVQPHLNPKELADLCGVCEYTVKWRWKRLRDYRPCLEDYLETKRRQSYLPDDSAA